MTDVRVTQGVIEVLETPVRPTVKVTQGVIEVLETPVRPSVKVTQAVIEVLYAPLLTPPAGRRTYFTINYTA